MGIYMKCMTSDDIFRMEVINVCDGARLGCPDALEMDINCATVSALLVPCETGWAGLLPFGKREVWRIPWCKIECIGQDTILVRLNASELSGCCQRCNGGTGKKDAHA